MTANGQLVTAGERARDAAVNAGQQVMSGFEWWLLRSSEIPTTPFLDSAAFPWAQHLPARWRDIRAELDDVLGRQEELPTAFFSILSPHKRIPPHRGPYRGVVRCHLGLMVPGPPECCGISVGGEVRHWREGETLFFDDGYEHFAWNDSGETRVVLFLDIVRPLRRPAADVNRALLKAIGASPFLRDAKRRHQVWESRFGRLAR